MSKACSVCGKPANFTCGGCKLVSYCGKEHQKQDWRGSHKSVCKPLFRLEVNEVWGRHLLATRNISKGELIFQEPPLVIGPKAVTVPLCLGCHLPCGDKRRNCDGCGYPLCSVHCQVADAHFDECQIMMKNKFRAEIDPEALNRTHYAPIVPLRILLLKEKNPEKYKKIMEMVSHLNVRVKTPLYVAYKKNVAEFLRQRLGFSTCTDEEILNIAALLDTNAFEVRLRDRKLRALYAISAMMAHECVPNTRHTFHGSDGNIAVSATTDIPEGTSLTVTYTQSFWGTLSRREHLRLTKCFDCTCKRCSDPTELGTYLGAFRCSRCATRENYANGPKMIAKNPLDDKSEWHCTECGHKVPGKLVKVGNQNLKEEVSRLDKSTPNALEGFLKKYGVESVGVLHPTNSFVVQVKHALVQMYGNRPGYSYAGNLI